MADPVTMGAVSIGGSVLSGILGAGSAEAQGAAQANMYNYQAGVAKINQAIAAKNEEISIAAGEARATASGIAGAQTMGKIRAGQGASGLDVGSGSAVDVRTGEAEKSQFDEAMIRSNASREAYGYKVSGFQSGQQAVIDQMSAANAKTAGDLGAAGSIIGGASSVADKWMKFKTAGIY